MRAYLKRREKEDPVFKARRRQQARKYLQSPKGQRRRRIRMRKYLYERRRTNIQFKLRNRLRVKLITDLRRYNGSKSKSAIELLGCSIQFLRKHLETQFQHGMTWENWSIHGWHIDHIKPCASFDLTKLSQQRICFHYKNLQPLWAKENIRKGKAAE